MRREIHKTKNLLLATVYFIHLEDETPYPTIFLKDTSSYRVLPISIGTHENSMIVHLSKTKSKTGNSKRPSTYQLLHSIIKENDIKLESAVIDSVEDGIFYSYLVFENKRVVDSRPSDAIAMALVCEKPILIHKNLMKMYSVKLHISGDLYKTKKKEISNFIKRMRPGDF